MVSAIDVQAWVLDDTGFPKDGKDSPGVKRQYSGTLGKTGNCQVGVSVHAVGRKGTVPLGWALYLPEEWCEDSERRRKAKIPDEVVFKTKPELGVELVERAAGWGIARAPILGDCAYGKNTELRERLDGAELEYVLSVSEEVSVFAPETIFEVPAPRHAGSGRQKTRPRPDREPEQIGELIARLGPEHFKTVTFRDGPDGERMRSRFCFLRVRAAHEWEKRSSPRREEWLIVEWPKGKDQPTDYWLSNLPADTKPERLARLARLRWKIELDYKQLKGELGLDHYEGRSWLGWYHHTALVTAVHGFLTLERHTQITSGRPNTPPGSPTAPAAVQVLDRPLPDLPTNRRPRQAPPAPNPPRRVTRANKALLRSLMEKGLGRSVRSPDLVGRPVRPRV